MKKLNVLDILLDENNNDPIVLTDQNGARYSLEQIAVIPRGETVYAILKPIEKIDGIEDDEAVVFRVDESGEEPILRVETDEATAVEVFGKYYDLIEEAAKKRKTEDK